MKEHRSLINDPYFRVEIDLDASSPRPAHGIWRAQHTCVSPDFAMDAIVPKDPAQAIIDNQLKVKHWSVLEFGFVVLHFGGFPHDTVMQIVRHQDCSPLVTSMRYTGQQIVDVADDVRPVESVFYVQPVGDYTSRNGRYTVQPDSRDRILSNYHASAVNYRSAIENGESAESARRQISAGYRQNFTLGGTVGAMFHMLDRRTLADSQIEAQTLAYMALDVLERWEPGLFSWYRENRAGRNLLAP